MNKAALLAALTGIHEKTISYPTWGIDGVLLREFTARERQYAQEAAQADAPADPDQVLYRAMLLQRCLTDPATGRPYTDGRADPSTGQPRIDPRTRTPIFSIEDVQLLADSRALIFNALWDDLLELAALGPQAMFSGNHADERSERNQGAGATGTQDAAGGDESLRPGDTDGRGEMDGGPEPETRDAAGSDAGHALVIRDNELPGGSDG